MNLDEEMDEIFFDLSARFIVNLPQEEMVSLERICFQVEAAHWYYEDFIREQKPYLPSFNLKPFSALFFSNCPILSQRSHEHEKAFADFMRYKTRVPVCGAILLNVQMTHCVLVKGWKPSSAWSFPKGKINLDERQHLCAIREVLEETGFDCTNKLIKNDYIDVAIRDQKIRLYIIPNVPMDTEFKTQTRKEISKIEWFKLTDLPSWRRNTRNISTSKFYLITPFIGRLKAYVKSHKPNLMSPEVDNQFNENPIDSLFGQLSKSNNVINDENNENNENNEQTDDVSMVDKLFSQCTFSNTRRVPTPTQVQSHYGTPVVSSQSPVHTIHTRSQSQQMSQNFSNIPSTAPLPNLQPFPPPIMPPNLPPVPSIPPLPQLPANASTNVPINFLFHPTHNQQNSTHCETPSHVINQQDDSQNLQQTLLSTLKRTTTTSPQLQPSIHKNVPNQTPSQMINNNNVNHQHSQNFQQTLLSTLKPMSTTSPQQQHNNIVKDIDHHDRLQQSLLSTLQPPQLAIDNKDQSHKQSLLSLLNPKTPSNVINHPPQESSNPLLSLLNTTNH